MKKTKKKSQIIKWDKLDNTANIFPVIASESMTSVYRISATLKREIDPLLLQEALDRVLPLFDVFHARLRRGIFWYYFETNTKEAPRVVPEITYPCRYISPYSNRSYLFRVTYYKNRINLEVFHVLTDGLGAITFLKELIYAYLRLVEPSLKNKCKDTLSSDTSLNKEDSYIKNYKKQPAKGYKKEKAFRIKNEVMHLSELGVIHGYLNIDQLKLVSKSFGVSINTYLLSVYTYSIYKEYVKGRLTKKQKPIAICVPVNLRPYFESITTKNFFAVISSSFKPDKEDYSFEEVLEIVSKCIAGQLNKENMERMISYGVANEIKWYVRAVPLVIKNIAVKHIYRVSAAANTSTLTNVGNIELLPEYKEFVERFHVILSMTQDQNIKGSVISFDNSLVFTISSRLKDTSIQKSFFRKLASDGVDVIIETNGVYYE